MIQKEQFIEMIRAEPSEYLKIERIIELILHICQEQRKAKT